MKTIQRIEFNGGSREERLSGGNRVFPVGFVNANVLHTSRFRPGPERRIRLLHRFDPALLDQSAALTLGEDACGLGSSSYFGKLFRRPIAAPPRNPAGVGTIIPKMGVNERVRPRFFAILSPEPLWRDLMYLFGQACGVASAVILILQPQFRDKVQILICCILNNSLEALNFLCIGQTGSAVFLCLVAVVQALVGIRHARRGTSVRPWETVLFFCLYVGLGLFGMVTAAGFAWELSWKNALELLPILGALLLMLSVFARDEQRTRCFLLFNAAAWAVYSASTGAAAFLSSVVSMGSTLIALIKYRRQDTPTAPTSQS